MSNVGAAAIDESQARDRKLNLRTAQITLDRSVKIWFATTAFGQGLFLAFILTFYYPSTLSGHYADWNRKPLIVGYRTGDSIGNAAFAAHVLLAAVITAAGLIQLVSPIRRRWPTFHRWSGRIYLVTALLLASGGMWMGWVRGAANIVGGVGLTVDAVLITACGAMAWYHAREGRFSVHRRWALRTFVVASAVWFMRIGYMAWAIATGGAGMTEAMDGPFDLFITFGNSLVPLAVLELYLKAERSTDPIHRYGVAGLLAGCAAVTAMGSIGAWFLMWSPYI